MVSAIDWVIAELEHEIILLRNTVEDLKKTKDGKPPGKLALVVRQPKGTLALDNKIRP